MALAQEARRIASRSATQARPQPERDQPDLPERGEAGKASRRWKTRSRWGTGQLLGRAGATARSRPGYGLLGDVERGLTSARLALAKTEEFGQPRRSILPVLALLHLYGGNPEEAFATMRQAREESGPDRPGVYPENMPMFDLIDGEVALAHHDYEHVLQLAERAITGMRVKGALTAPQHALPEGPA
jgi:hypothetical protein